jgi:hypothetical protein
MALIGSPSYLTISLKASILKLEDSSSRKFDMLMTIEAQEILNATWWSYPELSFPTLS